VLPSIPETRRSVCTVLNTRRGVAPRSWDLFKEGQTPDVAPATMVERRHPFRKDSSMSLTTLLLIVLVVVLLGGGGFYFGR